VLRARYLLGRLVQSGVTLIGVTAVLFAILHAIPGGPLRAIVGEAAGVDPAALRRAEALLGFDRPLLERYAAWLRALLSGDLGTSWTVAPARPVGPLLGDALGNTLLLTGTALVVAVALGGLLGTISALRQGSPADHLLGIGSLVLGGAPTFWLGLLLIVLFAVELGWLPAGGAFTIGRGDPADRARHLVLPVATLAAVQVAPWTRYTRAALLEVWRRDDVRTARAKGLAEWTILVRHAAPNALPPLVTLLALDAGALIAGATVTEAVFSYPGLGRLLLVALRAHDWPLVQGIALLLGVAVVLASLLAEGALAWLNPRLRG
jgi:peptide/nickel transport system permease protein